MTLDDIKAQERELTEARQTNKERLRIINAQLNRLARRRWHILRHPNWEETAAKAAWKPNKPHAITRNTR